MGSIFTREKGMNESLQRVREDDALYQVNYAKDKIFEMYQRLSGKETSSISIIDLNQWDFEIKDIQTYINTVESQINTVLKTSTRLEKTFELKLSRVKNDFHLLQSSFNNKKNYYYSVKDKEDLKNLLEKAFYPALPLRHSKPPAYNPQVVIENTTYKNPPAYNPHI
jgi:hypothetical protein